MKPFFLSRRSRLIKIARCRKDRATHTRTHPRKMFSANWIDTLNWCRTDDANVRKISCSNSKWRSILVVNWAPRSAAEVHWNDAQWGKAVRTHEIWTRTSQHRNEENMIAWNSFVSCHRIGTLLFKANGIIWRQSLSSAAPSSAPQDCATLRCHLDCSDVHICHANGTFWQHANKRSAQRNQEKYAFSSCEKSSSSDFFSYIFWHLAVAKVEITNRTS